MLQEIMPMAGQKYKGHTKQSFWMSPWSGRAFALHTLFAHLLTHGLAELEQAVLTASHAVHQRLEERLLVELLLRP